MRSLPFFVLDAFTDMPFAGNPAGVFFDDDGCLSDEEMRRLAGEVSLESAFVLPAPNDAVDLRLRYFTGTMEVPLCGHATVAALTALAHAGRIPRSSNARLRVATPVGVLAVALDETATGIAVTLFQNAPTFGPELGPEAAAMVADALGCAPRAIAATGLPVQRVSTGTPWLFAPVPSRAAVDHAPADLAAIVRLSREYETFGVYVFVVERDAATGGPLTTWGRCFAPLAGLNEDPVTGSASGALGAYLAAHGRLDPAGADGSARFVAYQGFSGGRGGVVRITIGPAATVAVTGTAVLVAEGTFRLP